MPNQHDSKGRSRIVGVRLSPDERTRLEALAAAAGLTPSGYLRGLLARVRAPK